MTKKILLLISLIVTTITLTEFVNSKNTGSELTNQKVDLIKYGTSLGFCKGYCFREFVIDREKIVTTQLWWQKGKRDLVNFPNKIDTILISETDWKNILLNIDKKVFFKLPKTIGCPDCRDGGSEWIEIHLQDRTHKVIFERGKTIESIKILTNYLRKKGKIYLEIIEKRTKEKTTNR